MSKVYLRKRKDAYIEVDPQIIRWRNQGLNKQLTSLTKLTAQVSGKSKLGRPKGKKKEKFKSFF